MTPFEITGRDKQKIGSVVEMTPGAFRTFDASGRAFGDLHATFPEAVKAVRQHCSSVALAEMLNDAELS